MLKTLTLFTALLASTLIYGQWDCVDLCTGNVDPNTGELTFCWISDFNCDARVDVLDLPYQLALYGCAVDENAPNYHQLLRADSNLDGLVSVADLLIFVSAFGNTYE
ncbi:MAG: hypothetical protein RLZZ262_287 [Bacteroidota bacterium]|jgi:hypothetical protein